jgi:hypothetical protein
MSDETGVALPERYFRLLEAGVAQIEAGLAAAPDADLETLETRPGWRHFPSAILVAAALYAREHPANQRQGDPQLLALAQRVGTILTTAHAADKYTPRLDSHRDTYMWLESYRLLRDSLSDAERALWQKALLDNLAFLAAKVAPVENYPRYCSPFIITSPNHLSLWASTLYLGGKVFGDPTWEALGERVMHRFAVEEQAPDGYWGEHSPGGPTTGYDYLTVTAVALYYEYSQDSAALEALRRSTDFHKHYTYPDGTPVETVNDRNRHWEVSMWGHFGFSHFPDGRRYAAFLTGFFPKGKRYAAFLEAQGQENIADLESLGRIAQSALYFHEGDTALIPQDLARSVHQMTLPAGIRKTGPWTVCLSGLIATQALHNQFYLDRQANVSVFHERAGLIITGANSKRQPELATFWERIGGQDVTIPQVSRLQMDEERDRLALAYNTFFAELTVPTPSERRLELNVTTTFKYGEANSQLTLQLVLKPGQRIETAAGRNVILGDEPLCWDDADLGGWIRHNGWTMQLPVGTRLTWPVYPFNPYHNRPETDLSWAVGALCVPLRAEAQAIPFAIEVAD